MLTPARGAALRCALPCLAIVAWLAGPAHAHLHWTRTNSVGPDTIALYSFTNSTAQVAPAVDPLPTDLGLRAFSGAAALSPITDVAGSIFGPTALGLPSTQTLRTTATVSNLAGDISIECWFKWNPGVTSSTLEFGLQSGGRVLLARDVNQPSRDSFGIAGTHGSFIPAPGFTNWQDLGDEEAGLDEWRHIGLAVHSTGIHYDPHLAHDVYSTGTVGRLYLNGHAVGSFPHTIDLSGLQVHDASRVTIIMRGGGMSIDEFVVWRRDWSENGAVVQPFANGRGPEAAVGGWRTYEQER